MDDIKQKALALLDVVRAEYPHLSDEVVTHIAILHIIEQARLTRAVLNE